MVATRQTIDSTTILGSNAVAFLVGTLLCDQSVARTIQGDSTTDETTEGFYLSGLKLAADLQSVSINATTQAIRCESKTWVAANQDFGPWVVEYPGTYGERGASFPGPSGGRSRRLSVLDIPNPPSADWEMRIKGALTAWASGASQTILARQGGTGNRGWTWTFQSNGDLKFTWFPASGSETNISLTATAANLGLTNGVAVWLRLTLDVDNGAGGYTVTMYKSTDEVNWTQVAQTVNTSSGATTIGNPDSSVFYEIGGRSNNVEVCTGNIYKVEIRDGIGGKVINPEPIERWGTANVMTQVGSPTLYLINGSEAGKGFDWFNDATRHPMMVRDFAPARHLISTGHNEGGYRGQQLITVANANLTLTRARMPFADIAVVLQNPETSPALTPLQHLARTRELGAWALRNGLDVVDVTRAFYGDARGIAALLKVDGVHPSYADGAPLWRDADYAQFSARLRR